MDINSSQQNEHQYVWKLLPWLVNNTLTPSERRRAQAHVNACMLCQQEIADQQLILRKMQENDLLPHSSTLGIDALLKKIDLQEQHGAMTVGSRSARFPEWTTLSRRPLLAAASLVAVLVGVGLVSLSLTNSDETAAYRTLTNAAHLPATGGPYIAIIFNGHPPEAERLSMLGDIGARIVSGPSSAGLYTIEIESRAANKDLPDILQQLRQDPRIRFAEQTYHRAGPDQ